MPERPDLGGTVDAWVEVPDLAPDDAGTPDRADAGGREPIGGPASPGPGRPSGACGFAPIHTLDSSDVDAEGCSGLTASAEGHDFYPTRACGDLRLGGGDGIVEVHLPPGLWAIEARIPTPGVSPVLYVTDHCDAARGLRHCDAGGRDGDMPGRVVHRVEGNDEVRHLIVEGQPVGEPLANDEGPIRFDYSVQICPVQATPPALSRWSALLSLVDRDPERARVELRVDGSDTGGDVELLRVRAGWTAHGHPVQIPPGGEQELEVVLDASPFSALAWDESLFELVTSFEVIVPGGLEALSGAGEPTLGLRFEVIDGLGHGSGWFEARARVPVAGVIGGRCRPDSVGRGCAFGLTCVQQEPSGDDWRCEPGELPRLPPDALVELVRAGPPAEPTMGFQLTGDMPIAFASVHIRYCLPDGADCDWVSFQPPDPLVSAAFLEPTHARLVLSRAPAPEALPPRWTAFQALAPDGACARRHYRALLACRRSHGADAIAHEVCRRQFAQAMDGCRADPTPVYQPLEQAEVQLVDVDGRVTEWIQVDIRAPRARNPDEPCDAMGVLDQCPATHACFASRDVPSPYCAPIDADCQGPWADWGVVELERFEDGRFGGSTILGPHSPSGPAASCHQGLGPMGVWSFSPGVDGIYQVTVTRDLPLALYARSACASPLARDERACTLGRSLRIRGQEGVPIYLFAHAEVDLEAEVGVVVDLIDSTR